MRYTHKGYVNLYKKVMTKKMALEIKDLRITKYNCSWRMVATKFGDMHPELKILKGNQMEGMELCSAAQDFLKEKWE
jgi:hypothetical protein